MSSFEKIPMGILDKVENNKQIFIAEFKDKLQEVFPSAVKDGIVDFEALLNEFGKYAETDEKEKYNMTWVGKKEAIKTANEDIIGKTLKYVPEDSKDPETTQNLYIEGDNLEVLKLLRNSYYGKIKMIYIDPPYNTGNDFIYKDNFKMDKEEYEKLEGSIDEYNERLTASKKDSGRYHSDWMNMMYPRLKLAKDLLKDDGFITISISDEEYSNLKIICDEVLGENNFRNDILVRRHDKNINTQFIDKGLKKLNIGSEHILIYSKNINSNINAIYRENSEKRKNEGYWKSFWNDADRSTMRYEILGYIPDEGQWKWKKEVAENAIDNYIKYKENFSDITLEEYWIKTGKTKKFIRRREGLNGKNKGVEHWIAPSEGILRNSNWNDMLITESISKYNLDFSSPKSNKILKELILMLSDKESIILDFFSGSATTADATMQLNSEDNGNRKFIMVQLPELCNKKSEAYKNGYKTICDIGRKRIDLAGEKIKEENKDKEGVEILDIGFKVFKVSDTNIRWISEAINSNDGVEEKDIITQEELRENESYKDRLDFNPWFTDLDVVYEMMLKRQDIELTERIEKLAYIGDRTYLVGYTILVCLEENITEEMVRKISEIETSLSWIVFRDSAFGDDINLKTNTINLLRTLIKEKNPRNKNQKILWI